MKSLVSLLLVLVFSLVASAQYYPGDYFSVTWWQNPPGHAWFLRTSHAGKITSMHATVYDYWTTELDRDNRTALVAHYKQSCIWKVDPYTLHIVGTLVANTFLRNNWVFAMRYDCNGDLFVGMRGGITYRVDDQGAFTTISTLGSGLTLDIDTGDLIISGGGNVYRVARDGSRAVTLGTGMHIYFGNLTQDILTGDIYVPTCCGSNPVAKSLLVLRSGSSAGSVFVASSLLHGAYGPQMDRASAPRTRIVTGSHRGMKRSSGGMWYIDLKTRNLNQFGPFSQSNSILGTRIIGSREIQTIRTAPARYDLRFSVPADAGKNFLAAISMSGVRPAVPLPDGRRIPLRIDDLTAASLNGGLRPFLIGNLARLDTAGEAVGKLDVSSIYKAVKGMRLWIILLTLDAKAPLGIATITDPSVLVID